MYRLAFQPQPLRFVFFFRWSKTKQVCHLRIDPADRVRVRHRVLDSNPVAFADGKQAGIAITFAVERENQCLVEGREKKGAGRVMVEVDHLVRVLQALPQDTNVGKLPGKPAQFLSLLVASGDRSDRRQATTREGTTPPAAKRIAGDGDDINIAPSDAALRQAVLNCCLGNAAGNIGLQLVILQGSLDATIAHKSSRGVILEQR